MKQHQRGNTRQIRRIEHSIQFFQNLSQNEFGQITQLKTNGFVCNNSFAQLQKVFPIVCRTNLLASFFSVLSVVIVVVVVFVIFSTGHLVRSPALSRIVRDSE